MESPGVTIDSTDFNKILEQNVPAGLLKTEKLNDDSYAIHNAIQHLRAQITQHGVSFFSAHKEDDIEDVGFSIAMTQWGRTDSMQIARSVALYEENDKIYHQYAGGIAEQFSNNANGIRQDFIIPVKPHGKGGIQIQLQIDGAKIHSKSGGFSIAISNSDRVLTYDHLKVMDANNSVIPAHMEKTSDNSITVMVDDSSATYPLIVDPTVADENWVGMGGVTGANQAISSVIRSGDNIYVAGEFTVIGDVLANHVAKWDGTNWIALGGGLNGNVNALAVDSKGNLYAAGDFTVAGGIAANHIAKWNGSVWSALGSGVDGTIKALAINSTDKLFVGGSFASAGGVANTSYIARWSGSGWSALGTGITGGNYEPGVNALAIDTSGRVYAGGYFTTAGGLAVNNIARWTGTAWQAMGTGISARVNTMAVDSAGRLYVGGNFSSAGGIAANCIARWSGSSWASLGTGVNGWVYALTLDSVGNLYVGGDFTTASGVTANHVAKWDGGAWSAVGSNVETDALRPLNALATDANDNLIVGGAFYYLGNNATVKYLAKWDGSQWSAFSKSKAEWIYAITVDATGNVYAAGNFHQSDTFAAVAKWNGVSWDLLGGMNSNINALLADNNGNLYVGGQFTMAGGVNALAIARWNGSTWSAMGSGLNGPEVYSLAMDVNGNIYAGGNFTYTGDGMPAKYLAKWDGLTWSPLGTGLTGGGGNYYTPGVRAMVFDDNGNLYVGGNFNTAGGLTANHIAKWNGSSWSTLSNGVSYYDRNAYDGVNALAVDASNNLYVGGQFTTAGDVPASYIAKWNGVQWQTLNMGMNAPVRALAISSHGLLYAGGNFTSVDGMPIRAIARWNGERWSSLGSGVDNVVNSLVFDNTGNLYVGGGFILAGGKVSNAIAKWAFIDTDGDGWADSDDAFPDNAAEWLDSDSDGIGNNGDHDDDNDGTPDVVDIDPINPAVNEMPAALNGVYRGSAVSEHVSDY